LALLQAASKLPIFSFCQKLIDTAKKKDPLPQRFNLVHVGIQPLPTPRFYQHLVSKKK
jgi:hypothetical protein